MRSTNHGQIKPYKIHGLSVWDVDAFKEYLTKTFSSLKSIPNRSFCLQNVFLIICRSDNNVKLK